MPQRREKTNRNEEARQAVDAQEPSTSSDTSTQVARSTALMSVATLMSRATGLIRTWAMAFALGNTLINSAYQVAHNMPNVIFELTVGGLLGAAFIPVFLLQKEKFGERGGNEFANNLLNIFIVICGVLAILATIFAPQVIATQTFTMAETDEVTILSVMFFRIFAVQILFYGVGGIITGILNANRVYFLPSVAPVLNNVCVIASFFAYIPLSQTNAQLALLVLAIGTTVGVFAQFAIQIPALRKQGFKWRPYINLHDPALIEALKIAIPTFIYIVGTMVAFSCRNAFSLQADVAGPSTLAYAWTWYQLPHGVVAVSLSRALFTEMSESVAKDDWNAMREHVRSGLAGTLLLIIPLAGIMAALSNPIMQLFQAGAFSADDVAYVARILTAWVISLPFYSCVLFLYNVYASMRKFIVFAAVSTVMVIVQCSMYAVLCNPSLLALTGVPIADFVYYATCFVVLLFLLHRQIGSFGLPSVVWLAARTIFATALACVAIIVVNSFLPWGSGMLPGLARLLVCGTIGLVVAYGMCAILRIPEMSLVTNLIRRFIKR